VIVLALLIVAATVYPLLKLGREFMPPLDEGTLFYMPTTVPAISVSEAARILRLQDRLLIEIPEVAQVFGKAGRAETATDPAPLEMFETVINLKPEKEWRPGMTTEKLKNEMNDALQIPGISNSFTMPIKARLDMLATGIRTPAGVKVLGPDLATIEKISIDVERAIRAFDRRRADRHRRSARRHEPDSYRGGQGAVSCARALCERTPERYGKAQTDICPCLSCGFFQRDDRSGITEIRDSPHTPW
jgi:Cu(I)/Ag(I) efflux system membrane protein CusA/SilA